MYEIIGDILLPFVGTAMGSMTVFFAKGEMNKKIQGAMLGFAAGIMVAASVWSLLIPAMNHVAADLGRLAFVPAVIGFIGGMFFLKAIDKVLPIENGTEKLCEAENLTDYFGSNNKVFGSFASKAYSNAATRQLNRGVSKLVMAVTIHNLPEGMAVGAILAGLISGEPLITEAGAFAVAFGIGVQNIPEGAIVSMPLASEGMSRRKAFLYSCASGAVEPLGAVLTILAAGIMIPALPYMLAFAAGAMIYVAVEELIPQMSEGDKAHLGTIAFFAGFSVMMTLDVALG